MEPRHIIRAAIAISVAGHLLLTLGFLMADARPFETSTTQTIAVDVVAPEDAPPPAKTPPAPEPPKPPDPFQLPKPDQVDRAPQVAKQQQASKQSSQQQQPAAQASGPSPAAQPTSQPAKQQASQLAAAQPATSPSPGVPEPDITVKYGVLLGLPNGDGGASAFSKADIGPVDTAAFRRHLKTCSELPASVAPGDKVRIVIRAFLEPDGRLIGAPTLIEASASAKGPALMQAAIKALQACQPYAMLPADKYDQWKVLDLGFTPQDFGGT